MVARLTKRTLAIAPVLVEEVGVFPVRVAVEDVAVGLVVLVGVSGVAARGKDGIVGAIVIVRETEVS
ncbi:MAG: hypothetical protein WKG07_23775 [Hymenobacter sp.]